MSVDDALVRRGRDKARLVAYVEQEPVLGLRRDLEDVRVRFYVEGREVGHDRTDRDGRARKKCRLPSGGADEFEARAAVDGRRLHSRGAVYTWRRYRTIVVVDVDHTLAETEYTELILEEEDEESDPLKRSRRVLNRLGRDYQILYLTARPRFLLEKTRAWLEENEYPPGPVVTAKGLRQSAGAGEFKRKALEELREAWPNLLIGIGDNASDAAAYGATKMLTLIVGREPEPGIGPHAIMLRDWKRVGQFFEANQDLLGNPEELEELIDEKGLLLVPLYPWQGD